MGACYSKKASGGNRSYSTLPMASTKLDEASRLARPTPYTRTQNANIDFASKKGIPMSTKYNSLGTIDQGDLKNIKNSYQSNIPRFSTSLPATSAESKTAVLNCNDNETLHVVNNNAVVNSRSTSNICNKTPSPSSKLVSKTDLQMKPKSIGSKSCPDKIISQESLDEKSRTPNRISGLPRQLGGKSSHSVSHINSDNAVPKYQQSKFIPSRNSSLGPSPLSKSSSGKGYESKDSLSDFDSGFGNSNMTDKSRPEDSDTIKDMEQLVLEDSSPTNNGVDACPVRAWSSTPKVSAQQPKLNLKAPSYKREPNGKWSLDEKHFGSGTESAQDPKPSCNSSEKSPKEKHSFKMNASENIFSTYASYKGLLSYQKKSFKPVDHVSPREAGNWETPSRLTAASASNSTNASCIPKIRKTANQAVRSSVFYVQNDSEKPNNTDVNKTNPKTAEQSPIKHSDSKQSSLDSDEKSDSTENGVTSPSSEVENREFLIDDEISDQPGLTFFGDPNSEESDVQSLKLAVSELHALQLASSSKRRTDSVGSYSSRKSRTTDHRDSLILGSDLGSSCSSIASDDLMLDYEKTFDTFPEGTVNEGLASPMKRIEADKDKVAPLRTEKKIDMDEKHRKRLHRRSSGPMSSVDKLEWRQRTVSLPLRPPRQMTVSENDDGSLKLDSSSYRLLCQDLNGVKTLLLRLKSVIQEAETINPFDQANPKNIFYQSLVHNDFPASFMTLPNDTDTEMKSNNVEHITQENADLKRQLVLLQQQSEEKDHTIHLLQQQMTKYLNCQVGYAKDTSCINAATQTERGKSLQGSLSSSSSSADDSIETLVSVQDDFEKSFRKNSEEQDLLKEHLKEVARLLDNKSNAESDC